MNTRTTSPEPIGERFPQSVCDRLAGHKRIRRTLPGSGRLHIDRPLPFLCVHRGAGQPQQAGAERLVTSEAAYLIAPGDAAQQRDVIRLVESVVATLSQRFGAFLIIEIWSGMPDDPREEAALARPAVARPGFRILARERDTSEPFVETLRQALGRVRVARQSADVDIVISKRRWPDGLPPLIAPALAKKLHCLRLGLEVRPVYRNPDTGEVYPLVLRELRRGLTRALRQALHTYACTCTSLNPAHFHVLGRRAVVQAVWEVDHRLAEVSDAFDLLLQVTPVNAEEAWRRFRSNRLARAPRFRYRALPVDPVLLKRRLYEIPLDRIEDPALWQLLRDKQDELDRRLTMLLDLNTPRFVHGSIQVFGTVSGDELAVAQEFLKRVPPRARDDARGGWLDAEAFARMAERELARYRRSWPQLDSRIEVRGDTAVGLLVSQGSLLIARDARFPAARSEALLQHEVGTHVLTYANGRAQPFRQLYSGLAGYEPLQEGLAVLAEYLVGGLSRPRLRLLAGRTVAVRRLLDGASFVETFHELHRTWGFEQRLAFLTTMRVYRGGGLTKDAVYFRGLVELMGYLARGGELDPLYAGKMALHHVPVIRELQWRKVLNPPPLRPPYLDAPGAPERLERVRSGLTLLQLIDRRTQ